MVVTIGISSLHERRSVSQSSGLPSGLFAGDVFDGDAGEPDAVALTTVLRHIDGYFAAEMVKGRLSDVTPPEPIISTSNR